MFLDFLKELPKKKHTHTYIYYIYVYIYINITPIIDSTRSEFPLRKKYNLQQIQVLLQVKSQVFLKNISRNISIKKQLQVPLFRYGMGLIHRVVTEIKKNQYLHALPRGV
jgi:hypothetical protein